jgi:glutathione synthase/RimK-type ligase-like ATP-grasp enzyme
MNRIVLLVSTASRWLGTARMPRSLARAGFQVALLAPRDSLALRSRFVSRSAVLSDDATPMRWLVGLVAMINDVDPAIVIPCDEVAIRLLFELVHRPPPRLNGDAGARVRALVVRSLGDPEHYLTSIDKTLLPAAAQALGIPVPRFAIAESLDEAVAHADSIGYPVVLKRRYGFASQGVAILNDRSLVRPTAGTLLRPMQVDLGERSKPSLLVQAFVEGPMLSQTMVAWEGAPLAGFAREREVVFTPGKGASAVVRLRKSPRIRDFTERLTRAFGMSGFFSVQYLAPIDGSAPVLLEINRRIVTFMHLDEYGGVDLCGALFQRLADVPQTLRADMPFDDGGVVASFPREWLRDPESPWLHDVPSDVPWDDPEVFEAMVALRNE